MPTAEGRVGHQSTEDQSGRQEEVGRKVDRMRLFWSLSGPELLLPGLTWHLTFHVPSIKWTLRLMMLWLQSSLLHPQEIRRGALFIHIVQVLCEQCWYIDGLKVVPQGTPPSSEENCSYARSPRGISFSCRSQMSLAISQKQSRCWTPLPYPNIHTLNPSAPCPEASRSPDQALGSQVWNVGSKKSHSNLKVLIANK